MNNLKIILPAILVFLLMSNPVLADDGQYQDVPQTHWAFNAIQRISQAGIVKGYPDKSFKPDNKMTREQFAIVLVNSLKIPLNEKAGQTFSDVDYNHRSFLYIDAVKWCIPVPDPKGYNFNFYGDRAITREEVAQAIVVALELNKAQKPDGNYLSSKYKDYKSISFEFRQPVAIAAYYGILSGDSDGNFRGKAGFSRAELCVVIDNLLQKESVIKEGFKPVRKPWTIEFVNFKRPDDEMVRDFPDYNKIQTFYGKVISKVNGMNNSHLIVRYETVDENDGVFQALKGKRVNIYLTDKDLESFDEGEWVLFYYDRDNNITSYTKDI